MRKGEPVIKTCPGCKQEFDSREKNAGRGIKRIMSQVYCSRKCMAIDRAKTHNQSNHHAWKGGVFSDNGYRRVNKYKVNGKRAMPMQHVLIMEQHIGRKLQEGEVVHHIDRDRSNNDLSNLQLTTREEHSKLHYEHGDYSIGRYRYVA